MNTIDPQDEDRAVVDVRVRRGELAVREDQEARTRLRPTIDDARADGVRAFGDGQLAAIPTDSLHAFGHEREHGYRPVSACSRPWPSTGWRARRTGGASLAA